ncbi:MAG: fluoride efflux transporter CrcB [Solirubrobacterales bacterium]
MRGFDPREITAIFAGGLIGGLARMVLSEVWGVEPGAWPWATFLVNILGALLLGYFATRMQERLSVSAYARPFIGTGFCGALTTFSAMQLELFDMIELGHYGLAAGYAAASLAAGLLAVGVSTRVVRRAGLVR